MKKIISFVIVIFILTIFLLPVRAEGVAPDATELLEKMDTVLRGKSHHMTVAFDVKTASWERKYKLDVWMRGLDDAFARILEPAKSEGQGFLRNKTRLWNYMPTAERTMLIPTSLMMDKFLGSDYSNDDFVKLSYLPRDYDAKIVGEEIVDGQNTYHLELTPKPDAPVTYGKLEIWLRGDGGPVRTHFFNEKLDHIRTLSYSDYKKYGDHDLPSVWTMENLREKDRVTTLTVIEAEFDIPVADVLFSKENLEKYP